MAIVDLLVRIRADIGRATAGLMAIDNLTRKVETAMVRNIRSIRRAFTGLIKSVVKLTIVMGVISTLVLIKAASSFAKFEQAIVNATSVTGKLGEEFIIVKDHLSKLAQELGRTTVFSAREAAEAMYDLASAGVEVATMTKKDMIPILDLAAATQAELKFSTETLTSTIAQFGLTIQDTERVADVLTGTITSTKATIEKMSVALAYVGPIAHGTGLSLEETAAALGMLYNAGLPASMAGTALRGALLRLMNPTGGAKDALRDLGLTVRDIDPTIHKFADIVRILGERQMTVAQSAKIFGVRAASGMVALSGASDKLDILTERLHDVQGLTREIAQVQLSTLTGSFTLLKSALEGLMISLGSMTNIGLKNFNAELRNITLAIQVGLMEGVKNLMNFLDKLGPTWESLKSIVVSVTGIIGDLAEMFGLAGEEGADRLANAINGVVGAIAKLLRWIDNNPAFTKFIAFLTIAVGVFVILAPVVMTVVGVFGTLVGSIQLFLYAATGLSTILSAIGLAFPTIGAAIAALSGPIGWAIIAISLLAAAWAVNLFGIRDHTSNTITWIEDRFMDFINFLGPTVTLMTNIVIGAWNYLVPIMRKMGWDVYRYQEMTWNNLERKIKDTSDVVKDETSDMSSSVSKTFADLAKELEIAEADIEKTLADIEGAEEDTALSFTGRDRKGYSLSQGAYMSGSGEYIGKTHPEYEALKAKEESPLDATLYDILMGGGDNLTANMGTKVDEQTLQIAKETQMLEEVQSNKMDNLEHLKELPTISKKLDDLEIEINNHITNNYSGGARVGGGGNGSSRPNTGLINGAKESTYVNKLISDRYTNPFGF